VKSALFPFSRLSPLTGALGARLIDVARHSLAAKRGERSFAVRALGKASDDAAPDLARILTDAELGVAERADAARALGALGDDGQKALVASIQKIAPEPSDARALSSAAFGVVLVALDALAPVSNEDRAAFEALAGYPLPQDRADPLTRRVVQLRCAAARTVANTRTLHPALVACDPDQHGRTGLLAVVKVLSRGQLTGSRFTRWQSLAEDRDPVVRQAALDLMPTHPEIRDSSAILTRALTAEEDGTVAAAARVVSAHPDRVSESNDNERSAEPEAGASGSAAPAAELVKALDAAFSRARAADSIEVHLALVDAAAALELLSFKPRIEKDCRNPNPTVREHAENALNRFGDRRRVCREQIPYGAPPAELDRPLQAPARLRFITDAGELRLTLDPALAPLAVTRIVELTRAGFYDGMPVHRVVPGFVTQLGDRLGDGFGGSSRAALPCETSLLEFRTGSVGIALSGRDTGSSQIFVSLAPEPHLNGDYALIGTAEPGWDRLVVGDLIRKAEVVP
jgi:cyclophilin family peptidyl-prolyl cis-trans isomerase